MELISKVFSILSTNERKRLLLALFAMIVSSLFDVVGVFSIVPFMTAVADPEGILEVDYLNKIYTYLGFDEVKSFLIFLALFSFFTLVLNNLVRLSMRWVNLKVSTQMWHDMNVRMFRYYLDQQYSYYLSKNSSELIDKIMVRVNAIVSGVIQPGLFIVTSTLTSIVLILVLLIESFWLTVVVFVFLAFIYVILYRQVQIRTEHYGQIHTQLGPNLLKLANEAFGGIKELKILGREKTFMRSFADFSIEYSEASKKLQFTQAAPPSIVEVTAIGTILLISSYLLFAYDNYSEMLGVIGIYVLSLRRIQPAIQEVFRNFSHIRYWRASFFAVWPDVEIASINPTRALDDIEGSGSQYSLQHGLEIDNVTFSYDGTEEEVLRGIQLKIPAFSTVGIVGGSGAGKTTLIDIILGLLRPQSGKILTDGRNLDEIDPEVWCNSIGYVPQHVFLADDSVKKNIAFGIKDDDIDLQRVEYVAKLAQIDRFIVDQLPDKFDTHIGERGVRLSGGQRQRMGIARALYHDPPILVLDEATSALDGITEHDFMQAIRDLSNEKTIIIIAHRLTTIKDCDTIFFLEKGQVMDEGTYDELILKNKTFAEMAKMSDMAA